MHDRFEARSISGRDVVAAWLVCIAVAAAALLYPEMAADGPPATAQAATAQPAQAPAHGRICAVREPPARIPHG